MNTHYVPRLLLRQFTNNEKATRTNCFNYETRIFSTRNTKNIFTETDLFPLELEKAFASNLESPFANLLNNKLLKGDTITINRNENTLIRKFFMIQSLRHPIYNGSWDEMLERTKSKENSAMRMKEVFSQLDPKMKEMFQKLEFTQEDYISNLEQAMNAESIDVLAEGGENISSILTFSARLACISTTAFWDCKDSGQEFILPKMTGISLMDNESIFYKWNVLQELIANSSDLDPYRMMELGRLTLNSLTFFNNYTIYPISPTRVLIAFSPYFRAFFPQQRYDYPEYNYPPLLPKEQFQLHFHKPLPLKLFEPCKNKQNTEYIYKAKKLTAQQVLEINSMLLNWETDEFIFRDFNKIRDSFYHYENIAEFQEKKHDFRGIL